MRLGEGVRHLLDQSGLLELGARDVHPDAQARVSGVLRPPQRTLMAGLAEDPPAQLADQTALLRERNEVLGHHDTASRMVPADERLDSGHPAVEEAEDRLIDHRELLALERPLQVHLELQALDDRRVHARLVHGVAALATALRAVHCEVGVAQQSFGVPRARGDPDARADEELTSAKVERRLERIEEALRRPSRVAGLAQLLQ